MRRCWASATAVGSEVRGVGGRRAAGSWWASRRRGPAADGDQTSFSGFTRLAVAMAERRELPRPFGRRSRRALLPASGFITVGVLAARS